MDNEPAKDMRGTCFVVMGFGKKTDFESGRTLDLDKTYKNIIKPAAIDARLMCIRADEIVHSGLIDVPMYNQLLDADVVVADLSTSNKNAFYELGVRHALKPYTTIVIAEDGAKIPFDVNHIVVRPYHHLGEDIGYDEVMRFRNDLTTAINTILNDPPSHDSPIYRFIENLTPPSRAALVAQEKAAAEASDAGKGDSAEPTDAGAGYAAATHNTLMEQIDAAQKRGDFITAKALLATIRNMMKAAAPDRQEDPSIIQRLALVTYKSKIPTIMQALNEAVEILATLNPETSNDPETLGLWGAVHKRLWEETKDSSYLDRAVRAYGRGFYLRNDHYNGINFAYLLNVRAANSNSRAEAIADFVQARRVREEVLAICASLLESEKFTNDAKYWVLATKAEASFGLGDEDKAKQYLTEAYSLDPAAWMKESTEEQLAKLKTLLDDSPLKFVQEEA